MRNVFDALPSVQFALVRAVGTFADERGLSAYLVGGIVRDLMLRRKNLDLDFVIEGDAIAFAAALAKALPARECRSHKDFGTATILLKDGMQLDFATCRSESYAYPGALPKVKPGQVKDDLFRRDFTINAMAASINRNSFGNVTDPFGGVADLKAKKIRVLHDESFCDDSTRILRAVRFEQRLDFTIEPRTLRLLREAIKRRSDDRVSLQRYFNELKKMMQEDSVAACLSRSKNLGLPRLMHKAWTWDMTCVRGIYKNLSRLQGVDASQPDMIWKMIWMGLMEPTPPAVAADIVRKLSFTASDRESFLWSHRVVDFSDKLCQNALSSGQVYRLLKPLNREMCLYLLCRCQAKGVKRVENFLNRDVHVVLSVDGRDAVSAGIRRERIAQALVKTLEVKIDNGFKTKKDELNFLKELAEG